MVNHDAKPDGIPQLQLRYWPKQGQLTRIGLYWLLACFPPDTYAIPPLDNDYFLTYIALYSSSFYTCLFCSLVPEL